jgi:membrane protease YdiL (CAAX protease family)
MYKTLSERVKAIVFYAIAFTLELVAAVALAPVLGELAVLAGMFTPTIAVLVMLLLVTRDGYTRAGWAGLGLHRLGMRVWWLALLGPLVVLGAGYSVVWVTGLASFGVSADIKATNPLLLPILVILVIAKNTLTGSLGEELGWRGYLLPHLESLGQRQALLLSGLLHGIWHLPFILFTSFYHSDGNGFIVIPMFLASLTMAGVIYGYLRLTTGSVWPAAIAHSSLNVFWELMSGLTIGASPLVTEYLVGETGVLPLIGYTLVAGWILYRMHRRPSSAAAEPAREGQRMAV